MAWTIRDLATEAMLEINAVASNETPKSKDLYTVLRRFNLMVDTLGADRLVVHHVTRALYDLVADQASYTIGPAGNWTAVRPMSITRAGFVDTVADATSPLETPIWVYTDEEWAAVQLKSQTGDFAYGLWYETNVDSNDDGTVWLHPIPSRACKVALYYPKPMSEVAISEVGLAVELHVPHGYRSMYLYNLAVDICEPFEKTASAALIRKADRTMTIVKRSNTKRAVLQLPAQLTRRKRGGFNLMNND